MLSFLRVSWLVLVCAFVFGLLLAGIYSSWQPKIEANRIAKLQRGIRSILAGADSIQADTIRVREAGMEVPAVIYTGYSSAGAPVGHVFRAEGTGFQDKIELLVGVDPRFEAYQGISVLFAAETPGFGDAVRDSAIFKSQFVGAPVDPPLSVIKTGNRAKTDDSEIVSITGATITSEAVTNLINRRVEKIREQVWALGTGPASGRPARPQANPPGGPQNATQ